MAIVKAYYVTSASSAAGYTNDGDSFIEIPNFNSYFNTQVAAVGIDPNNGNKVIFAGQQGGVQTIKVSEDNGNNFLSDPLGDWTTFNIDIDAANGSRFIVLDSNIFIVYGPGGIYKSIDGGQTFNIVNSDFSSLVSFTIQRAKLWMTDEYNGILGLSSTVTTDPNKLFITSDGGTTWTPIVGYDSIPDATQLISAVYMTSDISVMYVVGTLRIIKSLDGGNTWTTGVSFTGGVSPNYGAGFSAVNETVQYVLATSGGQNNALFKPSGIFWDVLSSDNTVNQSFLLSFYSELEGYTSRYIDNENKILRTFDGGVTWNIVDSAPSSLVTLESVLYNCGECPEDFTKSSESQCVGKSLSPNLCPQGFNYDSANEECICDGDCDCPPTEVVFVVDNGSSVIDTEMYSTKLFLNAILDDAAIQDLAINQNKLKIGLVKFNIDSAMIAPLSNLIGSSSSDLTSPLRSAILLQLNTTSGTGTNTAAGLATASDMLAASRYSSGFIPGTIQKIILVTDGFPNGAANASSSPTWTDTITVNTTQVDERTYSITTDKTSPCDQRTLGYYSDCDRCAIYERTLEIAKDLKEIDNVIITTAILAELLSTDLRNVLTGAQNPGNAPSIEAYTTYRALIQGELDLQTHIFPPSQNASSPYYVASGYQPSNPEAGGGLGLTGLTNQITGVPFWRLVYGTQSSTTNYTSYTTDTSGSWVALDSIYTNLVGTSNFNPFGLWNCATPPAGYAPISSYRVDGSIDVYVETFNNAAAVIAPSIAANICSVSLPVSCPEGCTLVVSGTNARCECEKTLVITPCIYNIYSCSDLQTPVYCSANDLSSYVDPNIVVNIQVDSVPVSGCFVIGRSTIDYCSPLDISDVVVSQEFTSCADCTPAFVKLSSCSNPEVYLYVQSDYLNQNIGKSIELFEYPGLCWLIEYEPSFPSNTANVSVKQIFDDCNCCKQYVCNI